MWIRTLWKFESSHDVHFEKDMLYTVIPAEGAVGDHWHFALVAQEAFNVSMTLPLIMII